MVPKFNVIIILYCLTYRNLITSITNITIYTAYYVQYYNNIFIYCRI